MKTKVLLQVIIAATLCADINAQDFKEVYKIMASHSNSRVQLEYPVSISGNYAVVGAYNDSEDGSDGDTLADAGSASIFERDGYGIWHEVQKIVASDRSKSDYFGCSVSISGNYILVGAQGEDEDESGGNTLSLAGSAYIFKRDDNGNWHEVQKIVASDRDYTDFFGYAVHLSGNNAIVASYDDIEWLPGNNYLIGAGAAYVFECGINGIWSEVQKLVASDRTNNEKFGNSISISDNYAIIGDYVDERDTEGQNRISLAGSAYIFERDGNGFWYEVQKIVASDRAKEDYFGNSVCISGNYALIGAEGEDEDASGGNTIPLSGSVYVFERNTTGTWQEIQKLVASDRGYVDLFGHQVRISGNYAIIGAPFEDDVAIGADVKDYLGSSYIFKLKENGKWHQIQKIVASGRTKYDFFGASVSISGNYAMVGTRPDVDSISFAYLYESCEPSAANDPNNIIENGDFGTCTLAPWFTSINSLVGASATTSLVDGTCMLSDLVISNEPYNWHIQLMQPFTAEQLAKLIPGSDYTLSFEAYSLTKDRQCHVYFGLNGDPWTDLVSQLIEISNGPQTYSFDFYYPSVFSTIKLAFELGSDKTSVIFDNIKLKRKVFDKDNDGIEDLSDNCADIANTDQADADQDGTGDACESNQTAIDNNTDKNSFLVFPNPAKDKLHIEVANGSVIQLMNMLGAVVQTVPVTENYFTMDIHELPKGMYLIKIVKDDFISLHKIIFQ